MSKIKEHLIKEEMTMVQLPPMSGQEIADSLGVTRQAVSKTLKRAMEKMWKEFMKDNSLSPFEAAAAMASGFNVTEVEMKKFFKLFPPKVRKEIEADAAKLMPKLKKK